MFNNCLKQPGEAHTNSLVHPKSCEIKFKFLLTLDVLPFNANAKHNLSRGLLFLVRLNIYLLNLLYMSCKRTGISLQISGRYLQCVKLGRFKGR